MVAVLFLTCPLAALKNSWGFICKNLQTFLYRQKAKPLWAGKKEGRGDTRSKAPILTFQGRMNQPWTEWRIKAGSDVHNKIKHLSLMKTDENLETTLWKADK